MNLIFVLGIILVIAVLSCKATKRAGLPILVGFIFIGILIGRWFGFADVSYAERICNFALLLIIFTGGFQTNFAAAKPVLGVSVLLSAVGTVLTAGLAGVFAYFVLGLEFYEAMLLGAVLSCTDAASVFSILRSKKLSLKNNLDSALQIESGSNDPTAYMLTVVLISMASGGSQNVPLLLAMQIIVGAAAGFLGAKLGQLIINKLNLDIEGLYAVLLTGVAFFIYGAAAQFGGNGFLAVYIGGIILGNSPLIRKRILAGLFGAFSMIAQVALFIVLGILFVPSTFLAVVLNGLLFALFLFFVARPIAVFVLMKPFGRSLREIGLVSWAGFRGASSIVFATYLLSAGLPYGEYVFSVVFFVCMLSVILQGSLIAPVAKALKVLSPEKRVLKTFTEYTAEIQQELLEVTVPFGSVVCGKAILELGLPEDLYILMIRREGRTIAPIQSTVIQENDILAIAGGDKEKLLKLHDAIGG
ncbi:MAG: potassium/proton antiporter [Oscillospiraceae bacterium]|nr:potassium/proton antiporter [Oscillospiraceae bacterium]